MAATSANTAAAGADHARGCEPASPAMHEIDGNRRYADHHEPCW